MRSFRSPSEIRSGPERTAGRGRASARPLPDPPPKSAPDQNGPQDEAEPALDPFLIPLRNPLRTRTDRRTRPSQRSTFPPTRKGLGRGPDGAASNARLAPMLAPATISGHLRSSDGPIRSDRDQPRRTVASAWCGSNVPSRFPGGCRTIRSSHEALPRRGESRALARPHAVVRSVPDRIRLRAHTGLRITRRRGQRVSTAARPQPWQ
jgi:hypothetical protein